MKKKIIKQKTTEDFQLPTSVSGHFQLKVVSDSNQGIIMQCQK